MSDGNVKLDRILAGEDVRDVISEEEWVKDSWSKAWELYVPSDKDAIRLSKAYKLKPNKGVSKSVEEFLDNISMGASWNGKTKNKVDFTLGATVSRSGRSIALSGWKLYIKLDVPGDKAEEAKRELSTF